MAEKGTLLPMHSRESAKRRGGAGREKEMEDSLKANVI